MNIFSQKQDVEELFLEGILEQIELKPPRIREKKPRVIVLSGPTGCGKSALAMMLAKEVKGEIISADSVQVYKGMDIGTAKPTAADQESVPHHLINIRHITEPYNVVDFYYEARHSCQSVLARNRIPIICGGSGFYLHALLYGPPSGPPSVPELRRNLEKELAEKGPEEMYEKLMQLDRPYAKTITPHDKHKIVRALEIIELTGGKVSHLSWKNRTTPQHYDFRCWLLNRPKSTLYNRINTRCEKMLAYGLLEEVSALEHEGLKENPSAYHAIGYRQSLEFLHSERSLQSYREFVIEFMKASRHYAKRQMTWFKKEPLFQKIDLDLHDPETAMEMILRDYESGL